MDLEERTIEQLPNRCQSCGAELTSEEKQVALEEEAEPVLCTTCAAEQSVAGEAEGEGPGG